MHITPYVTNCNITVKSIFTLPILSFIIMRSVMLKILWTRAPHHFYNLKVKDFKINMSNLNQKEQRRRDDDNPSEDL